MATIMQRTGAVSLDAILSERMNKDLAERIRFGANRSAKLADFDQRSDAELIRAAENLDSAMERERAMWEYVHRAGTNAVNQLARWISTEADASVRWNLLWLTVKTAGEAALPILHNALNDQHSEVRDWARLFLEELTSEPQGMEYSAAIYDAKATFDQTLPLQIAGYADVFVPNVGWVQARLSPLWFNYIEGRVLACTNTATFMSDLVIEKELAGYHADGSSHYEPFLFRGASHAISESITQHLYESNTLRPFYRSGKVKDGVPYMTPVTLNRVAYTERITNIDIRETNGSNSARGARLQDVGVVRSVRGQFSGWAYTDLSRFMATGVIEPGTVQLVSTTDPEVGHLANTVLYGTFRGKLGDLDGDTVLEINTIPCHGTIKGEFDFNCDGVADSDPYVPVA